MRQSWISSLHCCTCSVLILVWPYEPRARVTFFKPWVSTRADEWNVNKWAWEGTLKVVSKGEECIIKLEDKNTGTKKITVVPLVSACVITNVDSSDTFLGELYARAFLREDEPHPVEPVIDSSRSAFFSLPHGGLILWWLLSLVFLFCISYYVETV